MQDFFALDVRRSAKLQGFRFHLGFKEQSARLPRSKKQVGFVLTALTACPATMRVSGKNKAPVKKTRREVSPSSVKPPKLLLFPRYISDNFTIGNSGNGGRGMDGEAAEGVTLHLQCGIPVVTFTRPWDETKPALLTTLLERLASAGHCEIVLDLTGSHNHFSVTREWLDGLERLAKSFRSRRGRLGAVIGREQAALLIRQQAHSLMRWAATEEEAICYLKGLPRASLGVRTAAQF